MSETKICSICKAQKGIEGFHLITPKNRKPYVRVYCKMCAGDIGRRYGNRRRYKKNTQVDFDKRVDKSGNCWIWLGKPDTYGYGRMRFNGRDEAVHRLAYHFAYGEIPDGLFICHDCDNRMCVNPTHLYLGTNQDNLADMVQRGRSNRGEARPNAKLKEAHVRQIRARYQDRRLSISLLAKEYGVTCSTIRSVITFRSWRHVT